VIDVRTSNNKIRICHNGNNQSVSSNSVQAHLNHGDYLGYCNTANKGGGGEAEEETHEDDIAEASTSTIEPLVTKEISVYPNPSEGSFTLQLPTGDNQAQILITDMLGKVIERRLVIGSNTVGFDLSHIAKGTYNIHVTIGKEVYSSRVVLK
jgi:hypothetical protein